VSAYCTTADIQGEIQNADLIACTDDDNTGNINQTILNQVISNASGEIDRLVGNVYDTPFNPAPPSVESMAIIITCYRLYRRRLVPDEKNIFWPDYREVRDFLNKVHSREDVLDLSVTADYSQVQADVRGTIYAAAGGNFLSNSM
jgi:phage gp36-like protein